MIPRKQNIALLVFFILLLLLPFLDNIFNFSPVKNLFEKREPNSLPQFPERVQNLPDYFKNFEAFFNDNYGLRKSLISLNSEIMDNVFNESPSARAFIGKDGWLYFDNQNSILDAQGLIKIDDKKLSIMVKNLIENWQKLKAQNINYFLIIAADKSSIYPEFLPDFIKVSSGEHRADKLIKALKQADSNFPVIDLRPLLLEAKKNEIIYQKTDTHWNRRGAHFAYVEIMKNLQIKPHPRSDFIDIEGITDDGDIANIMQIKATNIDYDLKAKFPLNINFIHPSKEQKQIFHKPAISKNTNKNLPILFVYKDSFFDNMEEFFAVHFATAYFTNQFPCDLDLKIIKEHHANVVLQEFWEGRVEEVMNQCKE